MDWIKWASVSAGTVLVLALTFSYVSASRWENSTQALVKRLYDAKQNQKENPFSQLDLSDLPAPVQRYLRIVLKEGQPIISAATFSHAGTFNMSEAEPAWKPFTSNQTVVVNKPGFVWDARVKMYPMINVNVHDAYLSGEGSLRSSILGWFNVANMSSSEAILRGDIKGAEAMAQGELLRFLAETPLYPTSLLSHQRMKWDAIDDSSARVTLLGEKLQVTAVFKFNESGLIDTVWTSGRGRISGKDIEYMPWQGRFWNYAERGGIMVPVNAEVEWLTPEGPKPYYRGKLTSISFVY